jgi:hypothetical protein
VGLNPNCGIWLRFTGANNLVRCRLSSERKRIAHTDTNMRCSHHDDAVTTMQYEHPMTQSDVVWHACEAMRHPHESRRSSICCIANICWDEPVSTHIALLGGWMHTVWEKPRYSAMHSTGSAPRSSQICRVTPTGEWFSLWPTQHNVDRSVFWVRLVRLENACFSSPKLKYPWPSW